MPAPDYENDLVFPPRHDKTAYELQLENNKLQSEINRLREALNNCYEQASNWGACAELPVVIIDICDKALSGESEGK